MPRLLPNPLQVLFVVAKKWIVNELIGEQVAVNISRNACRVILLIK